jgi:hypothetical protein
VAGFEPVASQLARMTGMSHWRPAKQQLCGSEVWRGEAGNPGQGARAGNQVSAALGC